MLRLELWLVLHLLFVQVDCMIELILREKTCQYIWLDFVFRETWKIGIFDHSFLFGKIIFPIL